MNRKAFLVMWIFLGISGKLLRIIDELITPAVRAVALQRGSWDCTVYLRTICNFFCTLLLFALFLRLRKLYSSFSDSELTLVTRSVVLYIAIIAILLKLSKDRLYYTFLLWYIGIPVDGYINLANMLSGTYDDGNIPILLYLPSIFAPYLLLYLMKRNKKRGEQV